MKRVIEVQIDGKSFAVRSEADPAYVDELARFFEARYKEVSPKRGSNPFKQAVLAGLNIAEELFQQRNENEMLRRRVQERCERIQELVDQLALRSTP